MGRQFEKSSGRGDEHVQDRLQAYMDGTLDKEELANVRAHLESCIECRGDYTEMRATQHVLRSMPTIVPPHAFTLTEDMVSIAPKVGLLQRLLAPRNSPRFAMGSLVAFAILVMVFVGDYTSSGSGSLGVAATAMESYGAPAYSAPAAQATPLEGITANDQQQPPATSGFEVNNSAGSAAPPSTPAAGGKVEAWNIENHNTLTDSKSYDSARLFGIAGSNDFPYGYTGSVGYNSPAPGALYSSPSYSQEEAGRSTFRTVEAALALLGITLLAGAVFARRRFP